MELTFEWPSAIISLEPLPPFSPEQLDTELIISDIDGLSRSESTDKLLDHFNVPQQNESEPFDWFSNEKPIDIPFFECPSSPPFPYRADDVKPAPAPAYHLPATQYDAAAYPPPNHPYPSTSPAALYDPMPSSLLYSPPSEYAQSPPPALQPTAPAMTGVAQPNVVKVECCDPLTMSPAAAPSPFNAEWLKRETLTPPESPRDEEILKMLEEFEPEALERLMMAPGAAALGEVFASPAPTLASERSCGSPSACSDDSAGCASPYAASDGSADDADWMPYSVDAQPASSSNVEDGVVAKHASEGAAGRRRAGKPYSKPGVEERRLRKKEQNKNAATRYRLKKKAEVEEVKLEENQLLEQNVELRKQLEEVSREVRYLKTLMREAYRKKGLIK